MERRILLFKAGALIAALYELLSDEVEVHAAADFRRIDHFTPVDHVVKAALERCRSGQILHFPDARTEVSRDLASAYCEGRRRFIAKHQRKTAQLPFITPENIWNQPVPAGAFLRRLEGHLDSGWVKDGKAPAGSYGKLLTDEIAFGYADALEAAK